MDSLFSQISTPCFVVDRRLLKKNLGILRDVQNRSGCDVLLALKGFAMFGVFDLCREYLGGVCASSIDEARLGFEEFARQVHAFAPAYNARDIELFVKYCDHIIFNSFSQWNKWKDVVKSAGREIECGLRINPEYSEVEVDIYNPCSAGSRLGIKREVFEGQNLDGITGLHFHVMCEQGSDTLQRVLKVVEDKFGDLLGRMKWINFGGGHHITRSDYDVDLLCELVNEFKRKYDVDVILEPGEAVALNTGFLVSSVLDVIGNDMEIAILDTSAAAHMPDVLEMPYRPEIIGAGKPGRKKHTYRLGGLTCLAGDIIGEYSFDKPLRVGDKLIFCDMGHYSMVKTNTFNGVRLPDIGVITEEGEFRLLRRFGYEDYKTRLS